MQKLLKDYDGDFGFTIRIVKDKLGTRLNIAYFESNHFCEEVDLSLEEVESIFMQMKEIAG